MADNDALGTGPVWTPVAWLVGFIKRTTIHCYTQNMKALGRVVSEKKIFYMFFFHYKSMGANDPPGAGPFLTPGAWLAGFIKKDHYTLLHTKYESSGPCGFGEDVYVFPMTPPPPGRGLYGPQGHGWQDF